MAGTLSASGLTICYPDIPVEKREIKMGHTPRFVVAVRDAVPVTAAIALQPRRGYPGQGCGRVQQRDSEVQQRDPLLHGAAVGDDGRDRQ